MKLTNAYGAPASEYRGYGREQAEQELSLPGLTFQEEGHTESPDVSSLFCLLKRLCNSYLLPISNAASEFCFHCLDTAIAFPLAFGLLFTSPFLTVLHTALEQSSWYSNPIMSLPCLNGRGPQVSTTSPLL